MDENMPQEPQRGIHHFSSMTTIIVLVVFILLAAVVGYAAGWSMRDANIVVPTATTTSTATTTASPTTSTSVSPTSSTYETSALKLTIPAGWTATKAKDSDAAVNITDGNYVLYINATQQVDLAHLSNVFEGAPSADAVNAIYPGPCGSSTSTNAFLNGDPRTDWYIAAADKSEACNVPTDGQTRWYFSHILYGEDGRALFNGKQLVITMAYNTSDVNKLPVKGSSSLTVGLSAMTDIAKSITLK